MENILISACLLGVCCRYDGESKPIMQTVALMERYHLVPVCPEQLGGLPTPREPSERQGCAVVMMGKGSGMLFIQSGCKPDRCIRLRFRPADRP